MSILKELNSHEVELGVISLATLIRREWRVFNIASNKPRWLTSLYIRNSVEE